MSLQLVKEAKFDEIEEAYEEARAATYPIEIKGLTYLITLTSDTNENVQALTTDFLMYPEKQQFGHIVLADELGNPAPIAIDRDAVTVLHDAVQLYGYQVKAKRANLKVMINMSPTEEAVNSINW